MPYPRFRRSRDHKKATRTSGNLTLNSTSWANVDTGIDIVLAAREGDDVEVGISVQYGDEGVWAFLDAASVVGGSSVNHWGAGGASDEGISGWKGISGQANGVAGSVMKTIVAGDLSSGTVTLRLRYRTLTAGNKTLRASTQIPLQWYAKNLGPADPS